MKFSGWIEYNGKKTPSEIKVDKFDKDTFYTEDKDQTGNFTMNGKIQKSGRIDITKQYNGKHKVVMFGRCTRNDNFISEFHGCWEIQNSASGDFEYKLLNQLCQKNYVQEVLQKIATFQLQIKILDLNLAKVLMNKSTKIYRNFRNKKIVMFFIKN